uniref:Fungal-type protein kinase domain-containing protein n=1 Tax=Psilocybe cubensis TaxID=181762 RepID=A0A8H7XYE1_PSICU
MTSTNSKIKSDVNRQAANVEYKLEHIRKDLETENSTKCSFDAILKYFLSLVLRDDDPKKRRLDIIQKEIEVLQLKRYGEGNGDTTIREAAVAQADECLKAAGSTPFEHIDDKDDDTRFGSQKEQELIQERDNILDMLLHEALESVLPVANSGDVIKTLENFGTAFAKGKAESSRYGEFVRLCNNALRRLAYVDSKRQFREKDRLNIRFHRNDPSHITTHSKDMQDIHCKPDVVITPLIAALRAASRGLEVDVNFDKPPRKSFEWVDILSCQDFKLVNEGIPAEGNVAARTFFETTPPLPIVTEGSISKRASDDVFLAENPLPSKKLWESNSETPTSSASTFTSSAIVNNSKRKATKVEMKKQQIINGRVQCASYALEMMSYSAGVHHAINLLFTDGHVWIWYHDRQGVVQSDGLSIFADFARFLVLLFAFQRFRAADWGIIRCLNPQFIDRVENEPVSRNTQEPVPEPGIKFNLKRDLRNLCVPEDQGRKLATVTINVNNFLSHPPHSLSGNTTAVVLSQGFDEGGALVPVPMVCKIYHPEVERRHEGATIQVVRKIAADKDKTMLKHLPSVLFYGDVSGCTTHRIRSMIKRRWKGHRTLRILGLRKLEEITTVDGADFIKAWLETVICHAFLWKNYVEHGDPSLSNIMYDPVDKCGVLSDFDLSLLQWEPRVIGTDRTGTVPFMAIELLSKKYWEGKIQRFYHHELESFIWILAYVCLLYDRGIRKKNESVDSWRTSDYKICSKEKRHFYGNLDEELANQVQANYKTYWPMAEDLLLNLHIYHAEHQLQMFTSANNEPRLASDNLWGRFNSVLSSTLPPNSIPDQDVLLGRLKAQKPSFEPSDENARQKLWAKYSTVND